MKKQTIQYNSAGRKYGRKTGIKGPAAQIALNVYLWLVVLLALFPACDHNSLFTERDP